jgi:DNA-binding transcriptional MerR regulator
MSRLRVKIGEIGKENLTGTFEQIQEFLQEIRHEHPEAVGIDYEVYTSYTGIEITFHVFKYETDEEFSARMEKDMQRLAERMAYKKQQAEDKFLAAAKDLSKEEIESLLGKLEEK